MNDKSQSDTTNPFYSTQLPAGGHWSLRVRKGALMRLTSNGNNVGMVFYNPENLLERYNAPDTLKCQHTFKLTQGHCLYSDMGHIFASIVSDSFGWHDTMMGNSNSAHIAKRYGQRDYQAMRNEWHQNGHDAFLVELAKYGLTRADLCANINWFSKVSADADGNLGIDALAQVDVNQKPHQVSLRFEMDTLVVMHNCPHPMDTRLEYPTAAVTIDLDKAAPVADDDQCKNLCDENRRGFRNNELYNFLRA